MPLSWNEIRSRATQFSKDWETESSEHAEAKSFWDGFFEVFGVSRRRVASFEKHIKKIDGKDGFIDLLWKGKLLIEHKSRGKDLDRAHKQALDYFVGIKEKDLPRYIIVSDFERFRLYDLDNDTQFEFTLNELHQNISLFGFIAGYEASTIQQQDPVNIRAAELMGNLHDQMKAVGYEGHELEVYLVRLLFCVFAEDTGIFERQQFHDYIVQRTSEDGSDLASHLATIFHILNTHEDKRLKNRDEQLRAFPYVNGKLFEEFLPPAGFDANMRQSLLDCCSLDWSRISPAIFGSLFQSIMDKKARRNLGAHYTSEDNILKVINPLFLDELREEFLRVKGNKNKLAQFHDKLRKLNFFDPACGCGNFLVIAYRELRLLELEVLRVANKSGQMTFDVQQMIQVDVDQFFGIEIEEFPAQIAQVALWLMDHQMNLMVSEEFGMYYNRIPLSSSGTIVCDNALETDWNDVIPAEKLNYIMGNPPFLGKKEQSLEQKESLKRLTKDLKSGGNLDFVTGWYFKSVDYIKENPIHCAFVSTNSITQGEQAPVLWSWVFSKSIEIEFAHRTFNWKNEARGKAAVHCVIVGFSNTKHSIKKKYIFEYDDVRGLPHKITAKNINCYLVDSANILIENRTKPISNVKPIVKGCEATDDGHLIFTEEEKNDFIINEPLAKKYFKRLRGGKDLIVGRDRWCLWFKDVSPSEIKKMPFVIDRINKVRKFRLDSPKDQTVKKASTPYLFGEIRLSDTGDSIAIPKVSSERRDFTPISFVDSDVILNNTVQFIPNGSLYEFGLVQSTMHMAWMRSVAGRMKSDYQYSIKIVYNNFPFPIEPTDKQIESVEKSAKAVLEARAKYKNDNLEDLYDPLTMPVDLFKAHQALDKAVDSLYTKKKFKSEADRVAFLFGKYQEAVSFLPKVKMKGKRRVNIQG